AGGEPAAGRRRRGRSPAVAPPASLHPSCSEPGTADASGWGPPTVLTAEDRFDDNTQANLAVAADGRAMVIMGNSGGAKVSARPAASGPWTTPPAHLPWGRDVSGTQDVPVFMPDGRLVVIGMTDRPLGVGPIGLGDFMAAAALGPIVPGAGPPQAAAPTPVPPAASPQRQKVTPRLSFARNQSLRGRAIALTVRCSA